MESGNVADIAAAEQKLKEFVSRPVYKGVLKAMNDLVPSSSYLYLCGGTIRDVLLGKVPKDLDILLPSEDFDMVSNWYRTHAQSLSSNIPIKVKSFNLHTLKAKAAQGLKLLKLIIEVNSSVQGPVLIELDIREIKMVTNFIKETLEEDSSKRDFRVNAMQFEIRKHKLYDPQHGSQKKSGLTDIRDKTLTPVRDPSSVFEDRRRIIRAVRLSAQHGLKYSDRLLTCLSEEASKSFQTHNHLSQMVPDYEKCLRDSVNCGAIFEQLAQWNLIYGFKRAVMHQGVISDCLKLIEIDSLQKKSGNFEQLITTFKPLGAAIVVSLTFLKSALPGTEISTFIQEDNKLQKLLSTLMVCPECHQSNELAFYSNISKLLVIEAFNKAPLILTLLSRIGLTVTTTKPLPGESASALFKSLMSPAISFKPAIIKTRVHKVRPSSIGMPFYF